MSSRHAIAGQRAGFWRRTIATVIDELVVLLPVQIILAVLFTLSSGWIQGSVGLAFPNCTGGLNPTADGQPASPRLDMTIDCRFSFFGLDAKHVLTTIDWRGADPQGASTAGTDAATSVAAVANQAFPSFPTRTQTMLDSEDRPVKGIALDWAGFVVLLAYFVALQTKTGRTLGDRAMGIRLVGSSDDSSVGVALRKVVFRILSLGIGFYPMLIVGALSYLMTGSAQPFVPNVPLLILAALAAIANAVWCVTLIVQIARKRDPYYDRIAGTAVLRN